MTQIGQTGIDQLHMDATVKQTLRDFVASWEFHGGPVLFVGAGLSKHEAKPKPGTPETVKFASWEDLMEAFRQGISGGDRNTYDRLPADPLRLAELYRVQTSQSALLDLIARKVPSAAFDPGPAHQALRVLPWAAVVTTNYDDLLERSFEPKRRVCRLVTNEDVTKPRRIDDIEVIKMHGDLTMRDTIVIAEEDYRTYPGKRAALLVKVKQLLSEHPVLFVGFSLTDPNFVREIDGWIRDTMGALRLTAVAIVHSEPTVAERDMWKRRGVTLVVLPRADSLATLFVALDEEHRQVRKLPDRTQEYSDRVYKLEVKIREVVDGAKADIPAATRKLSELLMEILRGADTDPNGGEDALRVARQVSWGWHWALSRPLEGDATRGQWQQIVKLRDVYDALTQSQRRDLLMMILRAGSPHIRFEEGSELPVANTLLAEPISADERGLVYLYQAQIHRSQGEVKIGSQLLELARKENSNNEVKGRIAAEHLELLFLDGNAERLSEELNRPPADHSDAVAMCRHGSYYLLLQKKGHAFDWYKKALEQARNGDERYVALWGCSAARYDAGQSSNVEAEEYRRQARLIRQDERPATAAIEKMHDRAARKLLSGSEPEEVARNMNRYLAELLRLGWPRTTEHNVSFDVEMAVRETARLLLKVDEQDGGAIGRIKEGLTLLNVYGLAKGIGKLFETKHLEILARDPAAIEWFRTFVLSVPTLSLPRDARLTTTICGIPLLDDESINRVVEQVVAKTRLWLSEAVGDGLLLLWWEQLRSSVEHIPRPAALALLKIIPDLVVGGHPSFTMRLRHVSGAFYLWRKLGYAEPAVLSSLVDVAERLFRTYEIDGESWRSGIVIDVLGHSIDAGILSAEDRSRILRAADALLERLNANGTDGLMEVANLLALARYPSTNLDAMAARGVDLVRKDLRSSALEFTLHVVMQLLPSMETKVRSDLADLLLSEAEASLADKADRLFDRGGPVAAALCELSSVELPRRAEIVPMVQRLVSGDSARYGSSIDLEKLGPLDDAMKVEMALSLLMTFHGERKWTMHRKGWWLRELPPSSLEIQPVIDVLIGLLVSDLQETRHAAVDAVRNVFRNRVIAHERQRAHAGRLIRRLAVSDPSWLVRSAALLALPTFCGEPGESKDEVAEILQAATKADIALVRRCGEAALNELPRGSSTSADVGE
jgi:SIR2-like domain